ncbi:hypothetical protein TL16_g13037 [Triparma laevis f. inornata]|uniref:Uncharacterized protein n=1 Tax=Triparma laevis f. inornata TaxID=1714386 RepID=A0A9W7BQK1_9STRA|nr:hypothetical protein TL16_g13037 [Triparma laevis f. inornata]
MAYLHEARKISDYLFNKTQNDAINLEKKDSIGGQYIKSRRTTLITSANPMSMPRLAIGIVRLSTLHNASANDFEAIWQTETITIIMHTAAICPRDSKLSNP